MFFIKGTNTTPEIKISAADEFFEIKGNSNSSDINQFFDSVLEELNSQFKDFKSELICKFNLNIFNSSTYKKLIQILLFLNEKFNEGYKIKIEWYYQENDSDNKDSAKNLSDIFEFPFKMIELKKE